MCSVGADDTSVDGDDHAVDCSSSSVIPDHQLHSKIKSGETQCTKCGQPAVVILRRVQNVYCVNCLKLAVNHKFRSCLGKSHLMKCGEKILIAVSGGQSSVAMLHLTKRGIGETSCKKLLFSPVVVYVDESAALSNVIEEDERQRIHRDISCLVRDYGFPFYITAIEKSMEMSSKDGEEAEGDKEILLDVKESSLDQTLSSSFIWTRQLFQSIKSVTSKEDLLVKLRQNLLVKMARILGCSKVFVGDSESQIAIRVLSNIAQGKGGHLSLSCGFVDDRFLDVLIVRPMREILAKEISFYVQSERLSTVTRPTFTTKASEMDGGCSIQHVTEKFVLGLQREFPSTVSTIFRTSDKMSKKELIKSSDNCILCMAPALLEKCKEGNVTNESSKIIENPSCHCSSKKLEKSDLRNLLCYACRIILHETPSVDILPPFVLRAAAVTIRQSAQHY